MAESSVSHDTEVWKPVPGCPGYEASSCGRIKRLGRTEVLPGRWGECRRVFCEFIVLSKPHQVTGYFTVSIALGGGERWKTCVHTVVATAFHGPRPSTKHEVAHWDGDKSNNRPDNLRWATRSENSIDKMRHHGRNGGSDPCENHFNAKLTNAQAHEVHRRAATGEPGNRIAKSFGVSRQTIYDILNGRRWSKLPSFVDCHVDEQPAARAE